MTPKILMLSVILLVFIANGCTTIMQSSEEQAEVKVDSLKVDIESKEDTKKLIAANPIDLSQVARISKFRSCVGHDYSGFNANGEKESLRSMKHYIEPLQNLIGSTEIKIFAPFDGVITEIRESPPGKQMLISADAERSWNFVFFHVEPLSNIEEGAKVSAGQLIGHASPDIAENFDFGLKQFGFRQIFDSPFMHMPDEILGEYKTYGITTENIIVPKNARDNDTCPVQGTKNGDAVFSGHHNEDFVALVEESALTSPTAEAEQHTPLQEQERPSQQPFEEQESNIFYNQQGLVLEHYWPNSFFLKGDESEILLYNEGIAPVQILSSDMKFILIGKSYSQYSGTWEKFPSRQSWEKLEYVNIKPPYYKGEPLILQPGQKGKLHWHYKFDEEVAKQEQKVDINLAYQIEGKEYTIQKQLTRTVFSEVFGGNGHD